MSAPRPARAHPSGWNFRWPGKRYMPKGSILVVDDELEIREGLEALLKSEGFDVTLAETGEAGLRKLEDKPYDLTLLDVSLPRSAFAMPAPRRSATSISSSVA